MTFALRTQFHVERPWGQCLAVVAAFNQEKAQVGAFSVITNLRIAFVRISTSLGSGSPLAVDPSDKIQRQFSSAAA